MGGGTGGRNWQIRREEWALFWKVTDEIKEKGEERCFNATEDVACEGATLTRWRIWESGQRKRKMSDF